MEPVTLPRTGNRPLAFTGERIAFASSLDPKNRYLRQRWNEIAVYRTQGGRYVVSLAFLTDWKGERSQPDAIVLERPRDLVKALRDYWPIPAGIGWPVETESEPGKYADHQTKLENTLREAYAMLVSDVLGQLGEEFAERLD